MATKQEPGSIRDRDLQLKELLKQLDAAIHKAQRPGGDANLELAQQIANLIREELS